MTGEQQSGDLAADYRRLSLAMDACVKELSKLGLWGESNRLPSSWLWNEAPWLARGWLQHRARTKPRGYAGDFELLRWIYEGRLSDDPLGRLFDRYFQSQAAPQAVRNRMAMMSEWIAELVAARKGLETKIALVGSALGAEVRDACLRLSESQRMGLSVVLLDLDPEGIEAAAALLQSLLREDQISAAAFNLFRLPERPQSAPALCDCQLLLCPGLFDYLSDEATSKMVVALYERLAPGGRLVIFQFAPHNPTRAYMEWLGNWYLIYRDRTALERVVREARLPDASTTFDAESLGIDLYASLTRPFGSR